MNEEFEPYDVKLRTFEGEVKNGRDMFIETSVDGIWRRY
jgi:hypothetical protein